MKEVLIKAQAIKRLIASEDEHFYNATKQRETVDEIKGIYQRIMQLQFELHNVFKMIDFRKLYIDKKNDLQKLI